VTDIQSRKDREPLASTSTGLAQTANPGLRAFCREDAALANVGVAMLLARMAPTAPHLLQNS
jgi:hypothetical protein